MSKQKVLLGMSGGVDSTAAALLLQRQGYEVIGATLRLQDEATEASGHALRDIGDARAAADKLGIRHIILDWRSRFREKVLDYFAAEYDRGRTPNPCVVCNPTVKFPALLEAADREGAAYIATGHYARIIPEPRTGRHRLCRALSPARDQSYALFGLSPAWLPRILFPLGDCDKPQVRELAAQAGLAISQKADSQDICFVPDGDYGAFLERYTGSPGPAGSFVDTRGNILGRHKGIRHYTVGQRKGLGVSLGAPAFVERIDAATGSITLSGGENLFTDTLFARPVNWLAPAEPEHPFPVQAKVRYAHSPQPATVCLQRDGGVRVEFAEKQRAVTPGQAVVFYDRDELLGGGLIL